MPIQDVQVTINVAYPAPRIGLGRAVIFTQAPGEATYKEYTTLAGLEADYPKGTAANAKAGTVFMQKNRPDIVAVATYDTDIVDSLEEFYARPWHFALIANDVPAAQAAAATFIDAKEFKFVALQVNGDEGREAVKGKKRVLVFDHNIAGEHLDAAAVGHLSSLPVGSVTWKFHELKGVTPRDITQTELDQIELDNAIAYVYKAGSGQLSEGTLANGEYIDVVHGQDWVKADMENEISHALAQAAKFNSKLPYDSRGIGAIRAAALTTLERGFRNGIIAQNEDGLPDYTINALSRNEVDPQDRNERIYRGLTFEFGLAGAIHEVRVTGAIRI